MRFVVPITLVLLAAAGSAGCGGGSDVVAPKGSVYSYRIPPGFETTKALKLAAGGGVYTGHFTTALASSKAQKHIGEGIVVRQFSAPMAIPDTAALRAALPQIDTAVRGPLAAQVGASVSAGTITRAAGRPAVEWTVTNASSGAVADVDLKFVLVLGGPNAVEVVCRWGRTAAQRRLVLDACDALLGSLRIKDGKPPGAARGSSASTRSVRLPSDSMAPTYKRGDTVSYAPARHLRVGDVVVFHPPSGFDNQLSQCGSPDEGIAARRPCATPTKRPSRALLIKRIVAVGGDRIAIHGGRAIRNGRLEAEPFVKPCHASELCDYRETITVAAHSYYVLGDNRRASDDSRYFGPVAAGYVVGKATRASGG